jgi:hypothetical protein
MASEENVCDVNSLSEPFRTLISAAILAPSGDNTQPWKFEVDERASTITVLVDETRDTSPMNAGQRMSRIACGAVVANVERTAAWNGWATQIEQVNSSSVRIKLSGSIFNSGTIPSEIRNRHTNRKLYNGHAIANSKLRSMERSIELPEGIGLRLISERHEIEQCAAVIGQADAIMFGQRRFLNAFLDNVRFDRPPNELVEFGLSIGSLELNWIERQLLSQMQHLPKALVCSLPMRRTFQRKASRLVCSASGLCVFTLNESSEASDFQIGRVMQRAWLEITACGLAVQPMMSMSILNSTGLLTNSLHAGLADSAPAKHLNLMCPAAILRFGFGPPVSSRTGRLGWSGKTSQLTDQLTKNSSAPTLCQSRAAYIN